METIDTTTSAADGPAVTSIPVLIVGAGPAGLVTAIGLARHGVRSILVERHPTTSIFPRATGVSSFSRSTATITEAIQPINAAPPISLNRASSRSSD